MTDKQTIRKEKKCLRRALSIKQQGIAAQDLLRQARHYPPIWTAKQVLSYIAFAGEIDPVLVNSTITAQLYFPRITHYRNRHMQFFSSQCPLQSNAFGIREPQQSLPPVPATRFDLVLLPLVAFNRNGDRLGMGAGFYDRAFASRHWCGALNKPKLVGLAHHFQEAEALFAEPWDVPLDAIITDQELIII